MYVFIRIYKQSDILHTVCDVNPNLVAKVASEVDMNYASDRDVWCGGKGAINTPQQTPNQPVLFYSNNKSLKFPKKEYLQWPHFKNSPILPAFEIIEQYIEKISSVLKMTESLSFSQCLVMWNRHLYFFHFFCLSDSYFDVDVESRNLNENDKHFAIIFMNLVWIGTLVFFLFAALIKTSKI